MVDEKELDEFINNELTKDKLNQSDKIDESVENQLGQMGWLYDVLIKKLNNDKVCYSCKKSVKLEDNENIEVLEVSNVDKGLVAFCGVCKECLQKIKDEQDKVKQNGK